VSEQLVRVKRTLNGRLRA